MGEAERRRRRLRHHGEAHEPADAAETSASTAGVHDDVAPRPSHGSRRAESDTPDDGSRPPRGSRRGAPSADEGERGLRGLVGSGSSQVSVAAAMRARDAARPTADDLAQAEERVVLIRRNWVPREELPRAGR
ncbi:hypothetical protein [Micromonospora robiginosa]|uniref:Uncharacterized protein n=1 Tax=Micromonospora robiginosa TaxID=2749844 RepID=A0A7L6B687_9ACTN|nr:hypothetical protein [Micromonospora ferruginea]QLQ37399.1 hypothetical protein H1D33_00300 [Micromonospora ferruginea]